MSLDQSVSQPRGWAILAALLLAMLPAGVAAQEPVTITGKVTGASGEALRDVNVTVVEFGVGGWTGANGTYRLSVPGGRVQGQQVKMNARLIGFRAGSATITVTAGATIEQNFQLASDPLRLDVVVVTGAGTQERRERLATATATVDSGTISRSNEQNVIQALAGKVPSVLTNQGSGDAGASTVIRGPKTFGTSQPVIILDGVPISNATRGQAVLSGAPSPNRAADINPDDIEAVDVLKGAASTSIYGASAGSAGALEFRTKHGHAGPTTYNLRSTIPCARCRCNRSTGSGRWESRAPAPRLASPTASTARSTRTSSHGVRQSPPARRPTITARRCSRRGAPSITRCRFRAATSAPRSTCRSASSIKTASSSAVWTGTSATLQAWPPR